MTMPSHKQKTFQRTALPLGKKAPIFNLQSLQRHFKDLHSHSRTVQKIRAQSSSKIMQLVNRLSHNNQPSKPKQQRLSNNKKEKKGPMRNIRKKELSDEEIMESDAYKALKQEYLEMKNSQYCERRQAKKSIVGLNKDIQIAKNKARDIDRMRNDLIREVNSLNANYNDIKLRTYGLKCEIYARFGYQQSAAYYESQPEVDEYSDDEYEELLALEQRVGSVAIGYPQAIIGRMPAQHFDCKDGKEEKCCICCMQFEQGDAIFKTECTHVHHHQCLQKWLEIKRICPLCRQEIILR